MLTGVAPFAAESPAASLAAVLENVVDADPRIPPRLWLEVQRALAKRPYERRADARAMSEGLRVAAGDEAPDEAPRAPMRSVDVTSGALTVAGVPARARGPWIAGGLAGAVILAAGVGVALYNAGPRQQPRATDAPAPAALPAPQTVPPATAPTPAPAAPSAPPEAPEGPGPGVGPTPDSPAATHARSLPATHPPPVTTHAGVTTHRPAKPVATTPGF
jgi:hypothetical protein